MSNECEKLQRQAKENEKENVERAISLYKEAAQCYASHDNNKGIKSNYEKAAKLLWQKGRDVEDPESALPFYEEAALIIEQIGKEKDAQKAINEGKKKFIDVAKQIQSEANKMEDLEEAEKKYAVASSYYVQAGEEEKSREPWIELGDQYRDVADDIDDPIQAFDTFNQAVINYRRGKDEEKEYKAMYEAAVKFYLRGEEILKENKNLILAYYNFTQATNIFIQMADAEKQVKVGEKVAEIREIIGLPDNVLLEYLRSSGLHHVSIIEEGRRPSSEVQIGREPEITTEEKIENLNEEPVIEPEITPTEIQAPEPTAAEVKPYTRPNLGIKDSSDQPQEINNDFTPNQEPVTESTDAQPNLGGTTKQLNQNMSELTEDPIPQSQKMIDTEEQDVKTPKYKVPVSGPMIDLLKREGYIRDTTLTSDQLQKVPEYDILSLIIQYHPISLEKLESMTNTTSISMVLSNLTADGLVEQTPEFKYTLTQLAENLLM